MAWWGRNCTENICHVCDLFIEFLFGFVWLRDCLFCSFFLSFLVCFLS